jgi:hypothetical protein
MHPEKSVAGHWLTAVPTVNRGMDQNVMRPEKPEKERYFA